jgi:hypothetical protein
MTVRPTGDADRVWVELAEELTPAKSLARIDAATARVVTTTAVIGTLLTGLGLVAATASTTSTWSRRLAVAAVVIAACAVVMALSAQVLSVTRTVNRNNLVEVRRWYDRRFTSRATPTRWATILLVVAALAAGGSALLKALDPGPTDPTIAVSRTYLPETRTDTVTVEVTFRDLDPGTVATVRVTAAGRVVATAAFTPATDGTATRTVTADRLNPGAAVTVDATADRTTCTATSAATTAVTATCR